MLLLPVVLGLLAQAAEPASADSAEMLARVARLSNEPVRRFDVKMDTAEFEVESAARASLVYVLPAGPRTIGALELIPSAATADAWPTARIRLSWETDDPDPALAALDLPIGLAFGRLAGLPPVESMAVGSKGNAWVNRFSMPYRTRALLTIDTDRPLDGTIRIRSTRGIDADAGYLRGQLWSLGTRDISKAIAWSGFDLRAAPSRSERMGRLAGIVLVLEKAGIPPPRATTCYCSIDDNPPQTLDQPWSCWGSSNRAADRSESGPQRGYLRANEESGAMPEGFAAYRWFLEEPRRFRKGFSLDPPAQDRDNESTTSTAAAQAAAVFWYSVTAGPRPGSDEP